MAVGDEFEWGGPDIGGRTARLDAAMAERASPITVEIRHVCADDDPADARLALLRVTEFRAVFPDWDES